MRGWVKRFEDDKKIYGTDDLVVLGKASWRNSRNHGLVAVDIFHDDRVMKVECGLGEYWQSDTFVASFAPRQTVAGKCIQRRVCRQIKEKDVSKYVGFKNEGNVTTCVITNEEGYLNRELITDDMVGQWLVFELDTESLVVRVFVSNGKV
jgi:hypothetical protein